MADTFFGGSIELSQGQVTFQILEGEQSGIAVEDIETTYTDQTDPWREYDPGDLIEGGEYSFTVIYDPDIDESSFLGKKQDITIRYPVPAGKTTGASRTFKGYVKEVGAKLPIDDKMTAEITIKVAGKVTVTPSA